MTSISFDTVNVNNRVTQVSASVHFNLCRLEEISPK